MKTCRRDGGAITKGIMTDPNDKYLFLAYTLVWIVFMVYAWILSRRQSRLRIEIDDLKARKAAADGKG